MEHRTAYIDLSHAQIRSTREGVEITEGDSTVIVTGTATDFLRINQAAETAAALRKVEEKS